MANIIKKDEPREGMAMEWNPFRSLREWMRWDPFREMAPILRGGEPEVFYPAFEVRENKDAFVFKADLPGVKRDDLEVTLTGARLQINGKREAEHETKTDTLYTYERSYGNFSRVFTLPPGIDAEHVKSELKEGVLTLVVPKRAEAVGKKISIGTPGQKS